MSGDFDRRLSDHRRWYRRRYDALRRAVRKPGGRDELRAIRRAAASRAPRRSRRSPALTIALVFLGVLLAFLVSECGSG